MHRFAVAVFLLTTGSALAEPSLTISCEDRLFAKDSSHQRLVEAFGTQNVALVSEKNGPTGVEVKSVIFPKDPRRKLTVVWTDRAARAVPELAIIEKPSQWAAPNGVRFANTLDELERANGAPFTIGGFSAFLGGQVEWEGGSLGALPGGCFIAATMEGTVRLSKAQMDRISTSNRFPSTDALMRQARPALSGLTVQFKAGR